LSNEWFSWKITTTCRIGVIGTLEADRTAAVAAADDVPRPAADPASIATRTTGIANQRTIQSTP
jgi:hypothetical protein